MKALCDVKCTCCNDVGVVANPEGWLRPCSRCRADDFIDWCNRKARPARNTETESSGNG